MQVYLDVVLLGRTAPSVHLHNPGNGQEPSLQYPILDCAEIRQTEVWGSDYLIAVDFADENSCPRICGVTLLGRLTFCCRLIAVRVSAK